MSVLQQVIGDYKAKYSSNRFVEEKVFLLFRKQQKIYISSKEKRHTDLIRTILMYFKREN